MVGAEDAVEVDVAIGLHTFEHVGLAFVVEGLFEAFWRATHIAEMDKEDLLLLAKVTDHRRQVICHQCKVALAEADAVDFTGHGINQPLKVVIEFPDGLPSSGYALSGTDFILERQSWIEH